MKLNHITENEREVLKKVNEIFFEMMTHVAKGGDWEDALKHYRMLYGEEFADGLFYLIQKIYLEDGTHLKIVEEIKAIAGKERV
jgi:hypothetical protein